MDINPGQSPNPNGSPPQPGTFFQGPLMAGTVPQSDGSANLAGLGGSTGKSNSGYAVMAQCAVVTQASGVTSIVIPAQSKILRITLAVTTVWSGGATTMGIGTTAGTTAATALTTATGVQGSTAGNVSAAPSTAAQIANWENVSNPTFQTGAPSDVQILVTSGNTGTGVGTLTVEYIPGINMAS